MAQLCADLHLLPQVLINVPARAGYDFEQDPVFRARRAEVDQELAGSGRTLIRASGTEALIRVMVECPSETLAREHAHRLSALLA